MNVLEWLLDSDPWIRWQVMRDLTDEPDDVDRRRAVEGCFRRMGRPSARSPRARWPVGWRHLSARVGRPVRLCPAWTSTTFTLLLLRELGLDPTSEAARRAVALVHDNSKWEHDGQPFFSGEVEPCINGMAVALGSYFGQDVQGIVDRLLGEQMRDGGWNCEQENGSTRSSFHTTISVLEGLLEHDRATGGTATVTTARHLGEEYLLERHLFKRLSTGEPVNPAWTLFSYRTRWRYDVLRGLDYLRGADIEPDDRIDEAIEFVEDNRGDDGRWPLQNTHPGPVHFAMEDGDGEPSRWNTLPRHASPELGKAVGTGSGCRIRLTPRRRETRPGTPRLRA